VGRKVVVDGLQDPGGIAWVAVVGRLAGHLGGEGWTGHGGAPSQTNSRYG
jgi:hypothetical protein